MKKIIFPLLLAVCAGCASSKTADVKFRYDMLLQKAFNEIGDGRPVPVTVEKASETDGTVSGDGKYLFFTSDRERGNSDIFLRSMTDITTVRVTSHPAKDFAPAVSADGKYIAFVSLREDPQGDIYVLKTDAAEMIENSGDEKLSYDSSAKNISALTDPESRAPASVKDSDPAWSPDGKLIAFSSTRGGEENIWICGRSGKDLRRITSKGGIYPRFSEDSSRLVYVSYRDNPVGDIYVAELASGKETRVTSAPGIKLYPSFGGDSGSISYTMIARDTNGDGKTDMKDRSVLWYTNLA
ncbi:MAG: hypothetical protein ACRCUT_00315, partial [Spirochaetota bacterium]